MGGLDVDKEEPSDNHSTWRLAVYRQAVSSLNPTSARVRRQVRLLSTFPSPLGIFDATPSTLATIPWRTNSMGLTNAKK
jgi:hypothetical protein